MIRLRKKKRKKKSISAEKCVTTLKFELEMDGKKEVKHDCGVLTCDIFSTRSVVSGESGNVT